MVLGIITAIAACPAIIGTTEAVRQGQSQHKKQRHKGRKSNLLVTCSDPSRKARDIHGGTVVLRDKKVCISTSPLLPERQSRCRTFVWKANNIALLDSFM
jgi:hypothetical protein